MSDLSDLRAALAATQQELAQERQYRRLVADLYGNLLQTQAESAQLRQALEEATESGDPPRVRARKARAEANGKTEGAAVDYLDVPAE